MTNHELSVIMRLKDEMSKKISKAQGHMVQFSKSVQKTGIDLRRTGEDFEALGRRSLFFAAALTGPLALAFKNSADRSSAVSDQMERLQRITSKVQLEIATAMIPAVEKMSTVIANLASWFNNLSPQMKQTIVNVTLATGAFLAMEGITSLMVGKFLKLGSSVVIAISAMAGFSAVNLPLIAIAATLGGIIFAMMKWKDVSDVLMGTFEIMFNFLSNGFDTALAAVQGFHSGAATAVAAVLEALAKIPGPQQEAFMEMADSIRIVGEGARILADESLQRVIDRSKEVGAIFAGENGSWADSFGETKEQMAAHSESIKAMLAGLGVASAEAANAGKKGWVDFKQELPGLVTTLQTSLAQASSLGKGFARAAAAISIAMAIINTAQGVTRALKDYPWPFSMVVAGLVGAAGAIQIATIASQKFHSGGFVGGAGMASDEVPAVLQTGEGVLSRRGMSALGGVAPLNALNSGRGSGGGGGDTIINIGSITSNATSSAQVAAELTDRIRRERRYKGR